jgi:ribonuclease R
LPSRTKPTRHLGHAIVDLLADARRAMHAAEIASKLDVKDRAAVSQTLEDLVFDGLLVQRPGRRYKVAASAKSREQLIEGGFSAHPRGFGFVRATDGDDLYIPPEAIGGAMHGDVVRARIVATTSRGREGDVLEVLERRNPRVVGVLKGRAGHQRLEPDDGRLRGPIPIVGERFEQESDKRVKPKAGVAAVVEIEQFPEEPKEMPNGTLVAVLGEPGEPDVEIAKVLLGHGIVEEHPEEAVKQAQAYGEEPDPEELDKRVDLLGVPFLTIDPTDARDHDDAIWVERDARGHYQAWVAIADVSHYVTPNSPLDESALERGFSVYLPDRAIPMLPPELSTHLCSLVEGEERLCMCVHMRLDPTGGVTRTQIYEGKMRSRAFLSYEAVARALGFTTEPARDRRAEERRDDLRVMWDLASQLRKRRMRRGALDLDVPEARIQIDDVTRAPISVSQRGGDPGVRKAYRLIEELMLLANEAVAKMMISRQVSTIFRVHGPPDGEKLERLQAAMEALGIEIDAEEVTDPKKLSRFLRKVASHPRKGVIHGLILRALQQACYDTSNIGHFGLASEAYLHFTSPIRRYPDLVVHRILRSFLRRELRESKQSDEQLRLAAVRASELERNAMEAEREIADVYRTLYMQRHVGDRFDGVVSGISHGGVWVRLEDPFVDVLVPSDRIGEDDYEPDEAAIRMVGVRSGDTLTLGDEIALEIEDVSLVRRVTLAKRLAEPRNGRRTRKERKATRRADENQRRGKRDRGKRKGGQRTKGKSRGRSKSASAQKKRARKSRKRKG